MTKKNAISSPSSTFKTPPARSRTRTALRGTRGTMLESTLVEATQPQVSESGHEAVSHSSDVACLSESPLTCTCSDLTV
eukprot:5367547-Prymnesium_polylepis.1